MRTMHILIAHEAGVGMACAHALFLHHNIEVAILAFEDPVVQEQIIPFSAPREIELLVSALPTEEMQVITSFKERYSKNTYPNPVQRLTTSRGFLHRNHVLRSQHPP